MYNVAPVAQCSVMLTSMVTYTCNSCNARVKVKFREHKNSTKASAVEFHYFSVWSRLSCFYMLVRQSLT